MAGFDVVDQSDEVRRRIGVAAQQATVDGLLTGRFNLEMVGRSTACQQGRGPPARRRAPRAARPRRRRRHAGEDLLRRHAPSPRPRRQPRRPPQRALPRRADHRPRPEEPQRPVGPAARPRARRHHADPDHAVPRRGRPARRRHRGPRPRAHGGARHPRRAQGTDRHRPHRRHRRQRVGAGRRRRLPSPRSSPASRRSTRPGSSSRRRSPPSTRLIDLVRALDDAGIDAVDVDRRQSTLDDVFLTLTDSATQLRREPRMTATLTPRPNRSAAVDGVARHGSLVSESIVFARRRVEHIRQLPEKLLDVTAAAADVRAALHLRVRRGHRRRGRQLPRVPDRRDPRPDPRLRDGGSRDRRSPPTSPRAWSTGSARCRCGARAYLVGHWIAELSGMALATVLILTHRLRRRLAHPRRAPRPGHRGAAHPRLRRRHGVGRHLRRPARADARTP